MNIKLVNSLVQAIISLSPEERLALEKQLFFNTSEPSIQELIQLAQHSSSYNFLHNEPDIYTINDGKAV
jgi:hypothetical protein